MISQDYKMASLIPVIVLNFAGFLLCPIVLLLSSAPPFLFLLPFYSQPHSQPLSLLPAPLVAYRIEERTSSPGSPQRNSRGMIREFFCATIPMNAAAAMHR